MRFSSLTQYYSSRVKDHDQHHQTVRLLHFVFLKYFVKWVHTLKRGMSWNHLERAGTTWNELEPPRTSWKHLERARTPWNKTQKQEIHKKDLCMQHHCPTESNIGNSYCHKKHISDVCRWNHLEQNETNNDLTQIKTFIGHYYVYNIISLQEYFTNNYCYKEFHLMWRQGVPDLALHYIYFK